MSALTELLRRRTRIGPRCRRRARRLLIAPLPWPLNEPAAFVLCWTPDGAERETTRDTGGTGQAIRIAVASGVPVVNMARPGWRERLEGLLR